MAHDHPIAPQPSSSIQHIGKGWEVLHVNLPVVEIVCKDGNDIEHMTIFEDCTGYSLFVVLDDCERAYENWIEKRNI